MIRVFDAEQLCELQKDWDALSIGKDMTAFQCFWWNQLLLEEIKKMHNGKNACVIAVYKNHLNDTREGKSTERAVLLAPIYIVKHGKKVRSYGNNLGIYLWGWDSMSDYCGLIYDDFDKEAADELFEYVDRTYHLPFYMTRMLDETQLNEYLKEYGEMMLTEVSVRMRMPESMDCYHKSLTKHVRQNLRTASNRIRREQREMDVEFGVNSISDELVDEMEKIYEKRQRQKFITANHGITKVKYRILQLARGWRKRRYDIVAKAMKENNSWNIMTRIDNRLAAFANGLLWNGVVYFIRVSYDETYAFYSPMYQGIYETVKYFSGGGGALRKTP